MTSTLTHPRPATRPFLIAIAAFAAVVVALVLVLSAWGPGGADSGDPSPVPRAAEARCERTGPC